MSGGGSPTEPERPTDADSPEAAGAGDARAEAARADDAAAPRPLIERIGLGLIALVLAAAFGAIAAVAFTGGEVFLAVMAGIGALMTVWAAASTLRRG